MTLQTAKKLIKLNQDFYDRIGKYWNNDATYAWQGWEMISEKLKVKNEKRGVGAITDRPILWNDTVLKVLDLGCGNGRFYTFLQQKFPEVQIHYTGVDNSEYLLDLAHGIKLSKTTPAQTGSLNHNPSESKISDQVGNDIRKKVQDDINFYNFDLLLEDWPAKVTSQKYDLVVAFGLLHHVPRLQLRRQFLQQAAALLTNAGQFIFTTWRFNHIDRLRKRIVEPGSDEFKHFSQAYGLDEGDLDLGDYILNWVKKELAYRYSHDYSRQEIEELVADAGLQLVDSFRADGRTEDQNEYFVCQKKHPQTGA